MPVAHKMIVCIVPRGSAMALLRSLKQDKAIITANVRHARGVGRITPLANRGIGGQAEKEILSVVVETGQAEDIFAWIFETAGIGHPHGGLLYMYALGRATLLELPELPEES